MHIMERWRSGCQKISQRSLNQIFSLSVLLFANVGHTEEGGSARRCGGRTHEHFLLLPADIFLPQTPRWCACVPPGGTRAGEFTYGNSQRSTLPHTASKANQGSRATWMSVSKEASRGFRGGRLLLVLLQFFPSGPEPFSRAPREIHIATHRQGATKHIVKGQQSGTRLKKGKSSLRTLGRYECSRE